MADQGGESIPKQVQWAAWIVSLQAVGLIAVAVVLVVKIFTGTPTKTWAALLEVVFALFGAALFAYCARNLQQGKAGGLLIMLELLCLPVAYSLVFEAHRGLYGAPILVSAVGVLYLLFTPAAREVFDQED